MEVYTYHLPIIIERYIWDFIAGLCMNIWTDNNTRSIFKASRWMAYVISLNKCKYTMSVMLVKYWLNSLLCDIMKCYVSVVVVYTYTMGTSTINSTKAFWSNSIIGRFSEVSPRKHKNMIVKKKNTTEKCKIHFLLTRYGFKRFTNCFLPSADWCVASNCLIKLSSVIVSRKYLQMQRNMNSALYVCQMKIALQ